MKKRYIVMIVILIAVGSFIAGSWVTNPGGSSKATAERKILHYVDPMNPAFKSDKPGIAPCGMPLEPVYADQGDSPAGGSDLRASLPPGTIRVSPERQQLIGVKTAIVEKVPWSHTLRVLGRVAPDETLVYRINAAVNCTIENVRPVTTGSLVKKDVLLATYYAPEYRTTLLVYYNLIRSGGAAPGVGSGGAMTDVGIRAAKELRTRGYENYGLTGRSDTGLQKEYYKQILINYGFGETQLAEMERTLTIPAIIEVRAPVSGFIIYRNISEGLRVDRGVDLFRIADLSRVWILADIFENEASYFKPGMRVKVELPYQKKTLYAQVSSVLPQFDPATRTLKVRLVAENPDFALRPDMFANVEFPLNGPPAILVPIDAVLDSGLKKTVFVDRGKGLFETRQVETGRLLGERVEITGGLMPGEKIAVSGNFLIDSEARMQQAALGITGKIGRDPVCGMNVDEDRARAEGNFLAYRGQTYFFCEARDRDEFGKDPKRYLKSSPTPVAMSMDDSPDAVMKHPSHGAPEAPKRRGAKAAETHDGMTMSGDRSPAAMAGIPAASPKTEPKTEEMAMPPTAPSGMGHPQPQYPAGMVPPGEPAVAPAPAGESGQINIPPPGAPDANQTRNLPRFAPRTRTRPMPASRYGGAPPPQQGAPSMSGPPVSGMAPSSGTPEMRPQSPSFPAPGSGPPGAGPLPGGKAGEMLPPMTGTPGINQGPPAFPEQRTTPISTPQESAPSPGGKAGEELPPATGASDVKPR